MIVDFYQYIWNPIWVDAYFVYDAYMLYRVADNYAITIYQADYFKFFGEVITVVNMILLNTAYIGLYVTGAFAIGSETFIMWVLSNVHGITNAAAPHLVRQWVI